MLIFANRQLTLRLSRIKQRLLPISNSRIFISIFNFILLAAAAIFGSYRHDLRVFGSCSFSLLLKLPRVTPLFSCRLRLRAVMPVGTSGIAAFPLFGYHLFDLWRTNLWLRGFGKYLIFLSSPLLYHIVCAMSIVFLINVENIYKIRAYHYLLLTK